jgi:rare lipoprotein A
MSCSSNSSFSTKNKTSRQVHRKFTTNNVTKSRASNITYMTCSYYGDKFQGKPTANGEIFDKEKLTCAHKTLPFNTKLKITNEDNEQSVIVRVNDRGPFIKGRDLDLSEAAARQIGLIPHGVKILKVEFLED